MYAKSVQRVNTVDYTAGTAGVSAGDIVIQGGTAGLFVGIAHLDIPANTLGAISTEGIYDVVKGSSTTFATGNPVYWDNTHHVATTIATNNTRIGKAIEAAGTTASCVRMMLSCSGEDPGKGGGSITPASAITSLTDESSGSASNTIREIEDATIADACSSLAAKINAILAALRQTGIINQ